MELRDFTPDYQPIMLNINCFRAMFWDYNFLKIWFKSKLLEKYIYHEPQILKKSTPKIISPKLYVLLVNILFLLFVRANIKWFQVKINTPLFDYAKILKQNILNYRTLP